MQTTKEFINEVQHGNISVVKHTEKVLKELKEINKEYHYMNTISEEFALRQAEDLDKEIKKGKAKGKLLGLPLSVKDCICVKNVESTAGSKILQNYKPTFHATCIQKLINEGAIIIGKTAQDEFGFGSFCTNVGLDFKIPKNPFDKQRCCGGSSGGAAGLTQISNFPHIALAESTGGSIVNPASFCGVVGLCPTYGLVSRYGLIDYANSLDKIGPIAKTVDDAFLLLNVIKGYDVNDSTSLNKQFIPGKIKKIAIIKESLNVDPEIRDLILKTIEKLEIPYSEVSLPITQKYGVVCYYIIAMAEASTNLAKFCGLRYGLQSVLKGNFNEYFSEVRSSSFGKEAKRRVILGTFARMAGFREAYYLKAMKVRTLIIQEYKKAFKKNSLLVSPTMPIIAPKFSEIEKLTPLQHYMMDTLTVGPNLAGLPHLTTNAGSINKMPVGILFIADHLNETKLIDIGKKLS